MMDQLIARFPEQLKEALQIGSSANIRPHVKEINKAYVAGLGGSGIGANFVAEFIRHEAKIPYLVGKGYDIPTYIDDCTLAIVSSYSGNTEETLSSFHQIMKTGAKIVVISSGGQLIDLAKEHDLDYIQVPGDWPSPRACLGYSLVQQLFVLEKLGIIGSNQTTQIGKIADYLEANAEDLKEQGQRLAQKLHGKLPIIYTTDRMEAVAVRFRQQVNENAKMLCWHHVVPEMNHNELVGWRDVNDGLAVVYFRNEDDYERNQTRIEINKQVISNYTSHIIEVYSEGDSLVEKALHLVHIGDWASFFLAELRGVDAVEVNVIDYLKSELKKH
jgi:glucose/mannose-6-phosphate isomerase